MRDFKEHQPKKIVKTLGGKKQKTKPWERQEKRLAKSSGGKLQPGSGNGDFRKADIDAGDLLIEAKSTIHASLTVQMAWLVKVNAEAAATDKIPALAITFGNVPPGTPQDWVMVPKAYLFGI